MKSNVFFIDLRATIKESFISKIGRLIETAGLSETVGENDLTAVKLHFGELGNTAFIRPVFLGKIIESIKKIKGSPFLTDANTLYAGTRSDSPSHLKTAIKNGFAFSVTGAPVIIADGLRGKSESPVRINGKHFKKVYIGNEIVAADSLISVAHFKGHELTGFGGAIKNLGMGCASRRGKMAQHSDLSPKITKKNCIGCGDCVDHCSQNALSVVDEKAVIDTKKCIGCGECILICPNAAIQIQWGKEIPIFLESMVEYTKGVLANKKGKLLCINFITDVSPACDCYPANDAPIVRDIGVLASTDPIAIDQASVDLVNQQEAIPGTHLTTNMAPGQDKFKGIYPNVDWTIQLDYAETLGLGTRDYELVQLDNDV